MEIYHIPHNITVFGNKVHSFPTGIGEAFDELIKKIPKGDERTYYGISWCIDNRITYIAAAEQKSENEPLKYNCASYTVERGEYLSVTVHDWQDKVACIKDVFTEILKDRRVDNTKPAIEIYKSNKEMLCMVAIKTSIENLAEFKKTIDEIYTAANAFTEEELNKKPFAESWTAAQVIRHVTKSNKSIANAMKLEGTVIPRNADSRVPELRSTFLDETVKFTSPEFIIPEEQFYEKQKLIADLELSVRQLKESSAAANLSEAISHPAFGEITKLELLYFVLFHTQRHTKQLTNIFNILKAGNYYSNN